jgi:hypothetical protein
MKSDLKICPYDGLPCDTVIDALGFGACYVKDLDGKLRSVCPRFVLKSSVSFFEDLVSKQLIP